MPRPSRFKGGLAGVTVGSILEVHGLLNAASGTTSATRIESRKTVDFFLLRGVVSPAVDHHHPVLALAFDHEVQSRHAADLGIGSRGAGRQVQVQRGTGV